MNGATLFESAREKPSSVKREVKNKKGNVDGRTQVAQREIPLKKTGIYFPEKAIKTQAKDDNRRKSIFREEKIRVLISRIYEKRLLFMRKKLGLCLGAGGARGVAHVGFLQALEEAGVTPDYITGCSMGSVVGGVYACGVSVEHIRERFFSLKLPELLSPEFRFLRSAGFFKTDKMKKIIADEIGSTTFRETKIPFACVAVDLLSGKEHVFREGLVVDAIVASSSIPTLFCPMLTKRGEFLVDGGIVDRVPADLLKKMGADVVVAVDVLGETKELSALPDSTMGILLRMIDVMDGCRTKLLREKRKRNIDLWLEPELEGMSQYTLKDVSFAYERGYECGRANVEKIIKRIG